VTFFGRIPTDDDGPGMDVEAAIVRRGDAAEVSMRTREGASSPLTFSRLRTANVTRLAHSPGHMDDPWSTADWVVAVVGELGELANNLKKIRRGVGYPGMEMPTEEDIAEEIADAFTYLDLLAAKLGVDVGEALVQKFNKVSERWGLPDRL